MQIHVGETEGIATVRVEGEIDIATRDELRDALEVFYGDLLVDMSDVTFLDSSGISTLVLQRIRLEATNHRLRIVNPSTAVRAVLAITGLEEWIED